MEKPNLDDLRVQKTLSAISETFESMLLEMPYEKITVTSLCERARINKKTFYRYYSALDDLLRVVEKRFGEAYVKRTAGMRYPEDTEIITREFLKFSAEQGPLYDAIVCSGQHEAIFTDVMIDMELERYAVSTPPEGWTEYEWQLYMAMVTSAQWKVYREWVEMGRKVPLSRMVDIACRVICNGALLLR